ncbi:MAG: cysteine--tRNA ligase [Acidimicrobiia bacterium]
MIRLHDSTDGIVRELATRQPGKVGLYTCGPTVYGPPHLGHGRYALTYDVLRRYLIWTGLEVEFVSNITDIDDKIIDRANSEGRPWQEIATKCETIWFNAMDALGIMRPTHVPHATQYVTEMATMVQDLIDRGAAYVTSDGAYLSVEKVADYGLLARQSLDQMLAGGGERELVGSGEKHHPADFALWKFTKPGEPSWPAPFGDGRPGWHTECVVMSLDILGEGFDLHTGGQDLRFPHHENERAQAVALGRTFANHWMHNGFVVDSSGEKMSKSLGNFTNLLDLIETVDPRAYRLLVLQSHYRSPLTVDRETIGAAETALGRIDSFARRTASTAASEPDADVLNAFRSAMDDDLNTPRAIDAVFDAIRRGNAALDEGRPADAAPLVAAVRSMLDAVGLVPKVEGEVPAEIAAKATGIDAARAAKDFATADALRAELQAAGWVVETSKSGTSVRKG